MSNPGDSKSSQFDKAKKYLEQMREMGATASKRSLILLTLLAVVWLGGLEPAISEIHELETIPTQIENLQSKLTIQEQQKEKVEKKIDIKTNKRESENQDNTTLKSEIRKAHQENQEKEKTRITQKIKDLQITIEQLQKNGDNISFDSPLFKLVVSINLAPWIWLTLISGWFYYIAFTRSEMLSLYARAIESCNLKNSNPLDSYTKETLAQIVGVLPFWLAPLPHLQNESNQNDIFEIRNSQGLSIFLICFLALLGILLRIIYIGAKIISWRINEQTKINKLSGLTSTLPDWFWLDIVLAIISLILIILGIQLWINTWQVSINSSQEVKNVSKNIKRRKFIQYVVYFGVGIIATVLFVLYKNLDPKFFNQIASKFSQKKPRSVKKKKAPPLVTKFTPQEFYFNPNKKIIHYVLDDKTILGISQTKFLPNENAWKKASLQDLSLKKSTTPHLHLASASFSFEQAAIESLKNKNDKQACQLLLDGIKHDILFQIVNPGGKPSFRLYDLLAGLTVRYQQDEYFNNMIDLIKNNPQFESRREKWTNKNSSWYKRWENRKKRIESGTEIAEAKIKWKTTIMKPQQPQDPKKIKPTIMSIDL